MKFSKGLVFLLVLATFALLSHGAQTARRGSKKDKKGKERTRQQAEVAETIVPDVPVSPIINQAVQEAPADVEIEAGVVPSVAHNGKLGKKQKKEKKAAKKAERKAERKAAKKAAKKANKAEKKRRKMALAEKKERKATATNIPEDTPTELVSFDDIVEERHGDPIPNPLPPVESTSTETHTAGEPAAVNDQAIGKKSQRRQDKQQRKLEKKKARKAHRHHKEHITCESNSDCGPGSCCVEKKGNQFCQKSKKDEGQKCTNDCMCRAGLTCVSEEVSPGKEKRFCRVQGTTELDTGNKIGTVEDAVQDVIGANQ